MKKLLLIISCLLFSVGSANALTLNNDGTFTNSEGAIITKEQYETLSKNNNDYVIEHFDQRRINLYGDPCIVQKTDTIYQITTYTMDAYDNIIDQVSINATKAQAEAVAKDSTLRVMSDGTLGKLSPIQTYGWAESNYVSTESKEVQIQYYGTGDGYEVKLFANWFKLPKIRVYDIMALTWQYDVNIDNSIGFQLSDAGSTSYSFDGNNMKRTKKGVGISMNLHNNAKKSLELQLFMYTKNNPGSMWGPYQHARHSNATLAISKSYKFNIAGLGGVVKFDNSTYASYYDNMQGVHFQG